LNAKQRIAGPRGAEQAGHVRRAEALQQSSDSGRVVNLRGERFFAPHLGLPHRPRIDACDRDPGVGAIVMGFCGEARPGCERRASRGGAGEADGGVRPSEASRVPAEPRDRELTPHKTGCGARTLCEGSPMAPQHQAGVAPSTPSAGRGASQEGRQADTERAARSAKASPQRRAVVGVGLKVNVDASKKRRRRQWGRRRTRAADAEGYRRSRRGEIERVLGATLAVRS